MIFTRTELSKTAIRLFKSREIRYDFPKLTKTKENQLKQTIENRSNEFFREGLSEERKGNSGEEALYISLIADIRIADVMDESTKYTADYFILEAFYTILSSQLPKLNEILGSANENFKTLSGPIIRRDC